MQKQVKGKYSNDIKDLLGYYKDKVSYLGKQRMEWLGKFEQCRQNLKQKHEQLQTLKKLKQKQMDLIRAIVHHDIALKDEGLNVIRMGRQNMHAQYKDAEEIMKLEEIIEANPIQTQKQIKCKNIPMNNQYINNDLNIHSFGNQFVADKKISKTNSTKPNNESCEESKIGFKFDSKITQEELLKRELSDLKQSHERQQLGMKEQIQMLNKMIEDVTKRSKKVEKQQRDTIDKLNEGIKQIEKEHKKIAEKYFSNRRKIKKENQDIKHNEEQLQAINRKLEKKIQEEMKIYEKQNKAKQILIIKKSQDYEEDYKSRMRAKEKYLQSLMESYKKMQELCIAKIRKLQETVEKARFKLKDTENYKNYHTKELQSELKELEIKVNQQRIQNAQLDLKLKQKIEKEKQQYDQKKKKMQQYQKTMHKTEIRDAYERSTLPPKKKLRPKSNVMKKKVKNKPLKIESGEEEESEEDSMAMSDLQKIKEQINDLEEKIYNEQLMK